MGGNKFAWKNRAKGNQEEQRTIERLKKYGYYVIKSASSLGVFDMIAINSKEVRFIQVKYTKDPKKKFKTVIEEIENFESPPFVFKELWVWYPHIRDPFITTLQHGVTPLVTS